MSILLIFVMALMLPTAAFAEGEDAQTEIVYRTCFYCRQATNFEILRYFPSSNKNGRDKLHWIEGKCLNCGKVYLADGNPKYTQHTGGTETPTCTTGKTCEKCGAEYGKLVHDWGEE